MIMLEFQNFPITLGCSFPLPKFGIPVGIKMPQRNGTLAIYKYYASDASQLGRAIAHEGKLMII